jgi:hypothetical protein
MPSRRNEIVDYIRKARDRQNPSSPPFAKGRNDPSLSKRGEGRFDPRSLFYFEIINMCDLGNIFMLLK